MSRYFKNCFVVTAVLTLGSPGFAQQSGHENGPKLKIPTLKIYARLYNYAQVSRRTLSQAVKHAASVLHKAGVETDWVNCPTSKADAPKYPACQQLRGGPGVLQLRILSRAMARRFGLPREVYGFAGASLNGRSATVASVFHHRAEELTKAGAASLSMVLGHLLAHEIGHLLLGPEAHSRKGIMRIPWRRKDLDDAGLGLLLFTPPQGKRMRTNVLARMRVNQASHATQAAVP